MRVAFQGRMIYNVLKEMNNMIIITKIYKNISKIYSLFLNCISHYEINNYRETLNSYLNNSKNISEDWNNIRGDYDKIGNDIRKAIKNYDE